MQKKSINIIILLIIVLLLPGALFSIYEFSSLKRNEQVISGIYNDQLETVLNSINQYSDDILGSWAEEINRALYADNKQNRISDFLSNNYQVKIILVFDSTSSDIYSKQSGTTLNIDSVKSYILENKPIIKKLQTYLNSGYRKIEPLAFSNSNLSLFLFAINTPEEGSKICAFIINTEQFIRDILGPRMQVLTNDQIIIAAYHGVGQNEVYSSETLPESNAPEIIKPLWLFPDYNLGIIMKGETIKELTQRRSRMNILLAIIIDIILLIAIVYIYRNIRREMKLVQLKSEFISNVSHEIRTPLSLINMYIETLEMNRIKTDEKRQEYYRIIGQETNRLSGIVNNILNFSRIDSGKKKYKMEITNFNTIVGEVLNSYQYHLHNEGFDFTFNAGKQIPDIEVDSEAIADAVINLLENAIKYSDNNKTIIISTGMNNREVFIDVKDHGIGISANEHKMIFDKFYRVTEGSLAYKAKGTGLGLSIVKHIMDAHKGKVSIESEVDQGSTFRLSFPIKSK